MPLKQRKARWEALMENVETNDVSRWRDSFVDMLKTPIPAQLVCAE
jgi:trehalose 6-phosphate synthase